MPSPNPMSNFCQNIGCQCANPGPVGPAGANGFSHFGIYETAVVLQPIGGYPYFEQAVHFELPQYEPRRIVHIDTLLKASSPELNGIQGNTSVGGARVSDSGANGDEFRAWTVNVQVPTVPVFLIARIYVADFDVDLTNHGSVSVVVDAP